MSIFSRPTATAPKAVPLNAPEPITRRLSHAVSAHKRASDRLFDLCYEIQVTGKLPAPAILTEAIIEQREAKARVELLQAHST